MFYNPNFEWILWLNQEWAPKYRDLPPPAHLWKSGSPPQNFQKSEPPAPTLFFRKSGTQFSPILFTTLAFKARSKIYITTIFVLRARSQTHILTNFALKGRSNTHICTQFALHFRTNFVYYFRSKHGLKPIFLRYSRSGGAV